MDRYNHFDVEDFVWDTSFRQWVLTPTREIDSAWNDWLKQHPDKSETVQNARAVVQSLTVKESGISDEEIKQTVRRTIAGISRSKTEPVFQEAENVMPFYRQHWFRAAASVALFVLLAWGARQYYFTGQAKVVSAIEKKSDAEPGFIEKTNPSGENITVILEDHSKITLSPGGYIRYASKFLGPKREVFLTGEAFFEISKDPTKPFFVYANGLVTKVLGTSFRIKAYETSREVTVEVKTGRVSVYAQADPDAASKSSSAELQGIILSPNQKIIYARDAERMVKTLVEKPEILMQKSKIPHFEFEETPLRKVFDSIGKAYGIEILYDEDLMSDCPLTATLENQTLHEKLSIICQAIEANYEILDGQIVIHGKGCGNL